MTSLTALVALLVAVVAVHVQGCCVPDQWEGQIAILAGVARGGHRESESEPDLESDPEHHHGHHGHHGHSQPRVALVFSNFSYDATNQRFASAVCNHRRGAFKTIADFKDHKYYVIWDKGCKYFKLNKPFRKACTGNGTRPYNMTFGVGADSLDFQAYGYHTRDLTASIAVTKKSCAPVSETVFGRVRDRYFIETVSYINLSAGIKNATIFTPPAGCKAAKQSEEELLTDLEMEKKSLNFLDASFHI